MRKLALSDEILMKVDKPARYIGNEESRYYMICSTAWMTCGAREFILRGLICMKS